MLVRPVSGSGSVTEMDKSPSPYGTAMPNTAQRYKDGASPSHGLEGVKKALVEYLS